MKNILKIGIILSSLLTVQLQAIDTPLIETPMAPIFTKTKASLISSTIQNTVFTIVGAGLLLLTGSSFFAAAGEFVKHPSKSNAKDCVKSGISVLVLPFTIASGIKTYKKIQQYRQLKNIKAVQAVAI